MSLATKRVAFACFCACVLAAAGTVASSESPRSGVLHVTKDCASTYNFQAGDFCTITSSNVEAIEAGTRIVYASAANLETLTLDSDVVLDPPGPGNNLAFGRCEVNLASGLGVCRFSGGTGRFTHFQGRVDVSPLGGLEFAWDGTYSFSPRE